MSASNASPETVMRGRTLIGMFGSESAALEHTDPRTSGYASEADHEAVQAAVAAGEPPLMCHGGTRVQPHPASQRDVPPTLWQASSTPEGAATVIPGRKPHRA